jgi:arsenate reductase (glutaredoxin)
MITVYGIKNCDTMKKAFTWLDENKIAYQFHDYKKLSIDKARILTWIKKKPLEELINKKGITFKKLSEEEKNACLNPETALDLMIDKTSMIKRPILSLENGELLLGFEPNYWKEILL